MQSCVLHPYKSRVSSLQWCINLLAWEICLCWGCLTFCLAATNQPMIYFVWNSESFQMDVSYNNLQNLLVSLNFLFSVKLVDLEILRVCVCPCACACVAIICSWKLRSLLTWKMRMEGSWGKGEVKEERKGGWRESKIRWTALRSHLSNTDVGGRFLWTGRERASTGQRKIERHKEQGFNQGIITDGYCSWIGEGRCWYYPFNLTDLTSLSLSVAVCGSPPV